MATFLPQKPNFYSRDVTAKNTSGLQSVQNAGATITGTYYASRSSTSRPVPGTARRGVTASNTPQAVLQGVISGAIAGATAAVIDSALPPVTYGSALQGNYYPATTDPSVSRLINSGYPVDTVSLGPGTDGSLPYDTYSPPGAFQDTTENRVIIYDQTTKFIDVSPVMAPLRDTGGMLFPYTPTIAVGHRANYELEGLLHTNYSTPYFTNSTVDSINIQGKFTAQNEKEGQYVMAAMHFLRTATKMFYGSSSSKGSPPPIFYLDAHGQYMFDHIPVVVREFQYTLPNDVNYITAKINGKPTKVPVDLNITIDLIPTYSRNRISNVFSLDDFANGKLLTSNSGTRPGGWL
jgi:hypothetical protein